MATNITADTSLNINKLMAEKKIEKDSEFAKILGISKQTLFNWRKRNTYDISLLTKVFTDINTTWLLTGEGSMFKGGDKDVDTFEQEEEYYTYLLPVSAEGGSLDGFAEGVLLRDCERIVSPIKGADFAISIHGDSMAPEYPNGSKVIIKRVNERAFIEWGKAYVLDTCNGVVIKKLMPSSKGEEYVSCVSVNPDYPPFDVCLEDVYRVYRVMLCMSVK